MAARHLASVEPEHADRPGTEIPGNPFGAGYPRAFLRCLDLGHSWRRWRSQLGVYDGHVLRPQWRRRALFCASCGSQRIDTYNEWKELVRRRYVTPESRRIEGHNLNELRPEAREILLSEETGPDPDAPAEDPAGWDE